MRYLSTTRNKDTRNRNEEIGDYVFCNSGGENKLLRTGFIIHKDYRTAIIDFKPITDRFIVLHKTQRKILKNQTIINKNELGYFVTRTGRRKILSGNTQETSTHGTKCINIGGKS